MPKTTLDLTGKWEFKEYPLSAKRMRDLGHAGWQPTNVPCSIFNSLLDAGRINRCDIDTHPEKFSWVSEKPWVYRKTFDVPPEMLNCDRLDLLFDGLDTITGIWLNGKLIARTNNMFTPYRFDVTRLIKRQNNSLLVKFEPAAACASRLMNRYGSLNKSNFSDPSRVYIRKAQYQFGWDFCPSLPGCGIWQPLRLEAIKKAAIDSLHIRTIDCNHRYADVKIDVKLDTVTKRNFTCRLTLSRDNRTIVHNLTFGPGEDFQSTLIRIENPALWWPLGYGQSALYNLDVQLICDDEIIDRTQKQFGIRTVKLNCSFDKHSLRSRRRGGQKFHLEINGQRIFAKGANWVPASIFAGSVTQQDYNHLLQAAEKANLNMLRVWGGGYYETNRFYELCDRLGIMVWQDFMFACAYYPDRQWFLKEVKTEAAAVIKRLRNHPCLVLWCGNNEIDHMHNSGKLGKGRKFYGREIYHKILPQLVSSLDPDNDYIPTTPLIPKESSRSRGRGTSRKKPHKIALPLTTHQWQVWSGHQSVRQYLCPPQNIPLFVTEFGLQSLPNIETIKNFCPPDNLHIGSQILENHNHQLDGNSRLYRYTGDLFGAAENLPQFAYLSQITQARAVKAYVEHLRAHNFRNSGVLFWQFNDCSPAITWSAIDYIKQPKALYYYTKRFSKINDTQWKLNLKANAVVKDLLIQSPGAEIPARFSDNFLDMIPPYEVEIIIDSAQRSSTPPQTTFTSLAPPIP